MIAIRTRWTSGRDAVDPRRILPEILDVGVDRVVLDGGLRRPWLAKMRPEIEAGTVRVAAVEGFCPLPDDLKPGVDAYAALTLASEDPAARERAAALTIETLRRAADFECPVARVPLGRVEIDERRETFERFWREDRIKEEEGIELKEAVYRERFGPARRAVERARRGLDAIFREADRLGVAVAFATPEDLGDLPAHREVEEFLRAYDGAPIAYWHRPARAVRRERFGWEPEARWLDAFGPVLRAVDLDDLDGTEFRDLPGPDGLEGRLATPGTSGETLRVLDPDPDRTAAEIRDALAYLADLGVR